MALKLITPPADPVVTLTEAKAQLRVDTTAEDTLITFLIAAATAHIDGKDGWLKRALRPQTYDLIYDGFPCGSLAIPMRPLLSVESIKYDDEDGVEQMIDAANYEVDAISDPGWVVPIVGFAWPATIDAVNAVRVRFIAGYLDGSGDETSVPAPIRMAILIMVADLYQQRESVSAGAVSEVPIPTAVKALLAPFRVFE